MDIILVLGIILIISAFSCKATDRVGLPILVGFILIGILMGNWYKFDNMYTVVEICDLALLLTIFTGAFQTNFAEARPVLAISMVLSVVGTIITAVLSGAFAYYILRLEFYQAMLLGAVLSSTDAASVFSVLRSKQMELKNNLKSVLEVESGSNDPFAHMLTNIFLVLAAGGTQHFLSLLARNAVGLLAAVTFARVGQLFINRINLDIDGIYGVILCGIGFVIYGAANQIGANGFLAVYIGGVILGNVKLMYKGFLSRLCSAIYMLMQVMLFIVLGMLCIPSSIVAVTWHGLLFALFLFFIARPVIMLVLMKPFHHPVNEIGLVSWAGFRGASSIVFATHVLTSGLPYAEYVFSMVFFVCMMSVIIQGTFIVPIAKKLRLVDD